MLNNIVRWVIDRRWLVVLATAIAALWTFYVIPQMPLDVLPPFAPPQVEIQTEAPGLAPEEVESLVTLPIESAINGTPGVTAVRSSSAAGISAVRVIFNWGTEIYQARQLVTERLQQAASKLPPGVETPQISPTTSPVGLVVQYAFTVESENNNSQVKIDLMGARRIVDWQVTNRLLAVPGVSQVVVFGGDARQYQVLVDPAKLAAFNVSLEQVTNATKSANGNAPGGYLITSDKETLIRGIGRIESIADLQKSTITARNGVPVRLQDVAEVKIGGAIKRGDGSFNGKPAIILMVNKQPLADTPTVSRAIEVAMKEIQAGLPPEIKVTTTFRQDSYIDSSVQNVSSSLIQGSIIAAIILIPFLMNWRTLAICLLDFFLTLLFGLLALSWLGIGLNTMTLGGLAVAIGTAIDDAIVYGENTYRRLRENKISDNPLPPLEIIFEGSAEVRESLIGATVIGIIVFSPIFTLPGVEGRIFTPMGISYLVIVVISSLESLLVSPALCAILLPNVKVTKREPWLARLCKTIYSYCLNFSFRNSLPIIGVALGLTVAAIAVIPSFGRAFLPEFQEQTMVNTLTLYPGVSLEATTKAGYVVEDALKNDNRFKFIQTRAGRAEGDADAAGVNIAHVDIELSDEGMKDRAKTLEKLRQEFDKIPGAAPNVGGFISHRMDEVLSGVRSAIAVKIFGSDLAQLRQIGEQVEAQMKTIDGVVDLLLEPQIPIPQIQIKFDRDAASRYGLSVGEISSIIETALNGQVVSQVLENQQSFDLLVWLKPEARQDLSTIRDLLIDTPNGQKIPLGNVAIIDNGTGPNTINRENVSRLIVVSANAKGRDLRSIVNEIEAKVKSNVQVPAGYFIQYAGQFEAEERATQNILVFSAIAFVAITVLMYISVKSIPSTIMIMINLPIGLVGGVIAVALTGGVISVASLVGFVSLFGVATRNGLLLVDNYNSKFAEGMPLKEIILKGSMERLNAILMTALTSALGLAPMVLQGGPGQELLQPLSIVVFGGLFTSTAITLVVLPALYAKFGKHLFPKKTEESKEKDEKFFMHM
ncbi:efflux RND transporter permease subunit [Nostoc sp. FACHB-87]|uniref:efflux RND transporter permease subunit n=1 Tax=Nostocaceae TaxID=1162 RepID=UPI001689E5A0|nr:MULTISPECIES: efflux RND transporter permease subunit [Nostocaceae]MBD2456372.1 efflux RND transporter permease subunit [Nostoc sp. FACHB-87]MBD2477769.1 efflux RND transporter permease subunit [Anabaena sp. FACHB-83]